MMNFTFNDRKERSYKEGLRKGANFDDILCSRGRHSGLFHGWQCKTGKDSFRNKIWKPVMKSLGLPDDLTPHSARHTCATLLAAGGAPGGQPAQPRAQRLFRHCKHLYQSGCRRACCRNRKNGMTADTAREATVKQRTKNPTISHNFSHEKTGVFTSKTPVFGPSDWIRTSGLLNPIQARYQTSLHPDASCAIYSITTSCILQAFFREKTKKPQQKGCIPSS